MKKTTWVLCGGALLFLVFRLLAETVFRRENGFFAETAVALRVIPFAVLVLLMLAVRFLNLSPVSEGRACGILFFFAAAVVAVRSDCAFLSEGSFATAFSAVERGDPQFEILKKAQVLARVEIICAVAGLAAAAYLVLLGIAAVSDFSFTRGLDVLSLATIVWLWLRIFADYLEKPVNAANVDSLSSMACLVLLGLAYSRSACFRAGALDQRPATVICLPTFCYVSATALVTYIFRLARGAAFFDALETLCSLLLGVCALYLPSVCGRETIKRG